MKTKGAHSGNNGTEDPSRAALARPISTASTQHASIAPSKVGNRNSPRLLTEVSWGASTRRVSHCDAVRTLPCFSGGVGCDGEGSMPDSFLLLVLIVGSSPRSYHISACRDGVGISLNIHLSGSPFFSSKQESPIERNDKQGDIKKDEPAEPTH